MLIQVVVPAADCSCGSAIDAAIVAQHEVCVRATDRGWSGADGRLKDAAHTGRAAITEQAGLAEMPGAGGGGGADLGDVAGVCRRRPRARWLRSVAVGRPGTRRGCAGRSPAAEESM